MNRLIIALLLLSTCNGLLNSADADGNRPLLLNVIELSSETYRVTLRVPPTLPHANQPVLVLSERTDAEHSGTERPDQQIVVTGSQRIIQCIGGLQGKWLKLRYLLQPPPVGTIIRMTFADQQTQTAVLTPGETAWQVPYPAARLSVARDYFQLGLHHIWAGMDHLLFVVCLICIAGTWRRTFATITGFTIAHSITLVLSSLGIARLPVPPIKALIALSVVFLAMEVAKGYRESLTWKHPILISSGFGLLHGLGFAAALNQIGLPQSDLVTGLLFFNLGVEVG
jgi:hydrogenase/urease accessory protein HupE